MFNVEGNYEVGREVSQNPRRDTAKDEGGAMGNEQSRADDPKARSLYSSSFYYLNPSILKGGDDERTQMKLDRHYRLSPQCGFQSANMNLTTLTNLTNLTNETALP
jgi:hypothetical protein